MMHILTRVAQRHWFYLVLPALLGAALNFRAAHPWGDQPTFGEAVTLFDWCLFVPFLYVICYRDLPRRALVVRAVALMCGGIWVAGKIVPDSAEAILTRWGWLRAVGMVLLVLAEGAALIAAVRIAFGSAPDPRELENKGMPPLLVKLMLAEARFWRWVWARLLGK